MAAKNPARRPPMLHPSHIATGMVSSPNTSESTWVAVWPMPKMSIQTLSSA
jgi:hypothetical protein